MKQKSMKFLSALISVLMVISMVSVMPFSASAADETKTLNTYETNESTLAPGVSQTINYAYRSDGKYVKYYVAVADLSNSNVGIHATYGSAQCSVPGVTKMTEQVSAMTALHTNESDDVNYIPHYAIVAGVNGDGYNTTTGAPSGAHVMNGVSGFGIKKSANSPWFALFEDGTIACGRNDADWDDAVEAHGAVKEAIGGFQLLMKDGVVYEPGSSATQGGSTYWRPGFDYPCSFIGVTPDNKFVLLNCDGNNAGGSAGFDYDYTINLAQELGLKDLLCLDGGGSATYLSRPEGEKDVVVISNPSDGAERAVANGIVIYTTTPPSDVFERAALSTESSHYTPYSEVGITATGISPAGTSAEIPEDVEWNLSDDSFGTIADGVFTSNGKTGTVELQMVYNETVVGKTEIQIVNPTSVGFTQTSMVIPFGKTSAVDIEADYFDAAHNVSFPVSLKASDFTFTFSEANAGSMNGFTLVAPTDNENTAVTLTAEYKYATLDSFSISVSYGKGSEILWDFEDGDVSNWLGLEQALDWVENAGLVDSSPLTSAYGNSLKENTTNTFYMYAGNAPTTNTSHTFLATAENGQVKNGNYALGFTMDETSYNEYGSWEYNILFNVGGQTVLRDVANGLNATTLGMWVYLPEDLVSKRYTGDQESFAMQFQLYGGNSKDDVAAFGGHFIMQDTGKNLYSATGNVTETGRWVYMTADISGKDYVSLTNPKANIWREPCFIRFYFKRLEANKYTFYYDDFTLDYSSAVEDRDAPIISNPKYSVLDNAKDFNVVSSLNNVMFMANIADFVRDNSSGLNYNSAKIYVDGVALDKVTATGNTMYSEEVTLTSGTHEVVFEIADNKGTITRNLELLTISGNEPIWIEGHNDSGELAEYDSVYYMDLKVADASAINTVVTEISLNHANKWELPYLTKANGFTVDYEFIELTNSIKLTITKTEGCTLTGEQTLVSIPVRTWSWPDDAYDVTSKPGISKDLVTAQKMSTAGGRPIAPIDFEVEYGMVAYSEGNYDGYIGAFYDYFTTETKIQDETYAWHLTHTITNLEENDATCTEDGYTGRTYCDVCKSVVDWGIIIPATGHTYELSDNVLKCSCGETFTGVWTDGKEYVDGVIVTDGWAGDSYYVNGEKLTGVQLVDDIYYDFGEDGVCKNQMKFTGLFYDDTVKAYRYSKLGELYGGWVSISDSWHYFDTTNKVAVTGDYYYASRGITYHFDETGKTNGVWQKTTKGTRFWYGEWYYKARNEYQCKFVEIDGHVYNFDSNGFLTTGIHSLFDDWAAMMRNEMKVWEFDENGALIGQIITPGVIDNKRGGWYLIDENGYSKTGEPGLCEYNGDIYYICWSGKLKQNGFQTINNNNSNDLLPLGTYYFGNDAKLYTGILFNETTQVNNYYENGVKQMNTGVVEYNGNFYFVCYSGKLKQNGFQKITSENSNGLIEPGTYYFGEDNTLYTGIVWNETNQVYNYYKGGIRQTNTGLIKHNDNLYYVCYSGKLKQNGFQKITSENSNGLIEPGTYYFGEDNTLYTGIVWNEATQVNNYYKNGVKQTNTGVVEYNGNLYFVCYSGKLKQNGFQKITSENSNGLIEPGTYYFGEDNTLYTGIVWNESDQVYNYYKNGIKQTDTGLINHNGELYFVCYSGKLKQNGYHYITKEKSNGLLTPGAYYFDDDCKAAKEIKWNEEPSVYNYYIGNVLQKNNGLIYYNGEYFFVCYSGKLKQNGYQDINDSNNNGLPVSGSYYFDNDCKLVVQ